MKQTPKRLLCIALLVAMLITAALPCFAQDGDPTLKVTSQAMSSTTALKQAW